MCDREIKLTRLAGEIQTKRENIKPELARKNRPFLEYTKDEPLPGINISPDLGKQQKSLTKSGNKSGRS